MAQVLVSMRWQGAGDKWLAKKKERKDNPTRMCTAMRYHTTRHFISIAFLLLPPRAYVHANSAANPSPRPSLDGRTPLSPPSLLTLQAHAHFLPSDHIKTVSKTHTLLSPTPLSLPTPYALPPPPPPPPPPADDDDVAEKAPKNSIVSRSLVIRASTSALVL